MLDETGVSREVILLSMLENKDAAVFKKTITEHEVGNLWQPFQGVWRVGKDKVELLSA